MNPTKQASNEELVVSGRFSPEPATTAPAPFDIPPARRRRLSWPSRPSTTVAALVLAALSLLLLDIRGGAMQWARGLGAQAGGALQVWADRTLGPVLDQPIRRVDAATLEAEIGQLREEQLRLRTENNVLTEQLRGRSRVEQPPGLAGIGELKPTRVVASDMRATGAGVFTIALGARDGIAENMAVLSDSGLVGRTTAVTTSSSQVLMLSDSASGVTVRDPRSGERGVVAGTGTGLRLELVDPFAELVAGQSLVTVGSEGNRPFPPGLRVGTVAELQGAPGDVSRSALVEPAVDFSTVDTVAVLVPSGSQP